jgi:hypothetical protein
MNSVGTVSRSVTSTMTEARVRRVAIEFHADFVAMAGAGLASQEVVADWRDDLVYILENDATKFFQVQLKSPDGSERAVEYRVSADGSLHSSNTAGGIDYYNLPVGTKASLFVSIDNSSSRASSVLAELGERGWGTDGKAVTGTSVTDRIYSHDGYGVRRALIGNFS